VRVEEVRGARGRKRWVAEVISPGQIQLLRQIGKWSGARDDSRAGALVVDWSGDGSQPTVKRQAAREDKASRPSKKSRGELHRNSFRLNTTIQLRYITSRERVIGLIYTP